MSYFIEVIDETSPGVESRIRVPYPSGQGFTEAAENIQTVYSASVTLTDAQIKALPTANVEIVQAPGAGLLFRFLAAQVITDFQGGVYTNITDEAGFPRLWVGISSDPGTITVGGRCGGWGDLLIDDGGIYINDISPWADALGEAGPDIVNANFYTSIDDWANRPLVVAASNYKDGAEGNSLGSYTGGDAENSMTVTVYYSIQDVSAFV